MDAISKNIICRIIGASASIYKTDEFAEFNQRYALAVDFAGVLYPSRDSALRIAVVFHKSMISDCLQSNSASSYHNNKDDQSVKIFIDYIDSHRCLRAVMSKIAGSRAWFCECLEISDIAIAPINCEDNNKAIVPTCYKADNCRSRLLG